MSSKRFKKIEVTKEFTVCDCPHCEELDSIKLMSDEEHMRMVMEEFNSDGLDITNGWYIICSTHMGGCGAISGYGKTQYDAIRKWNGVRDENV